MEVGKGDGVHVSAECLVSVSALCCPLHSSWAVSLRVNYPMQRPMDTETEICLTSSFSHPGFAIKYVDSIQLVF